MNERDLEAARNLLRKFSHCPRQDQETILREWFGRKATAEFIAAAFQRAA